MPGRRFLRLRPFLERNVPEVCFQSRSPWSWPDEPAPSRGSTRIRWRDTSSTPRAAIAAAPSLRAFHVLRRDEPRGSSPCSDRAIAVPRIRCHDVGDAMKALRPVTKFREIPIPDREGAYDVAMGAGLAG